MTTWQFSLKSSKSCPTVLHKRTCTIFQKRDFSDSLSLKLDTAELLLSVSVVLYVQFLKLKSSKRKNGRKNYELLRWTQISIRTLDKVRIGLNLFPHFDRYTQKCTFIWYSFVLSKYLSSFELGKFIIFPSVFSNLNSSAFKIVRKVQLITYSSFAVSSFKLKGIQEIPFRDSFNVSLHDAAESKKLFELLGF